MQDVALTEAWYFEVSHDSQCWLLSTLTSDAPNLPAVQTRHELLTASCWYFPVGQIDAAVLPLENANWPATQFMQLVWASTACHLPAGHNTQWLLLVTAIPVLPNAPAAQFWHSTVAHWSANFPEGQEVQWDETFVAIPMFPNFPLAQLLHEVLAVRCSYFPRGHATQASLVANASGNNTSARIDMCRYHCQG
jgi:hypothetical protein